MFWVNTFNAIEVLLWSGMAVVVWFHQAQAEPPPQTSVRPHVLQTQISIAFVVFALSDVIELHTGVWWRPWPLAVLKVCCGLLIAERLYRWHRLSHDRR